MTENNVVALNDSAHFATGGMLPALNPVHGALDMLRAHTEMMAAAHQLAKALTNTSIVPVAYRSTRSEDKTDEAAAAILYGAELGLNPIQSLQRVVNINGKPGVEARTMQAMLQTKGFRFKTVETSDTSVTVSCTAPDGRAETSTWDIGRAERAGYTKNGKYQTDPQAMLYAKAVAEAARKIAPEVLLGMPYTLEDLELDPAPVRVESERLTAAEVLAAAADGPVASDAATADRPAGENPAPADDPEHRPIERARAVHLGKLLDAEGVKSRADKLAYLSDQFKRNFTAVTELTEFEGEQIISFLESGQGASPDEPAGGAQ